MSPFRTLEISDTQFEPTNLKFITVKTPNLKGRGDLCVYIPKRIKTDISSLPVAIFLHGVYGSFWNWAFKGGLHLRAQYMIDRNYISPMVIVMPSDGLWGDGSGFLPHNGYNFEKWISSDVPDILFESIPRINEGSSFFISGLSMGGFGALKIGAKYGNMFRGISAHSSITNIRQMELFVEENLVNYTQKEEADEDVFQTIMKNKDTLPPIRFDCGRNDPLIGYNRGLHEKLKGQEIPHVYKENPGGHHWPYWSKYASDSLSFFSNQF